MAPVAAMEYRKDVGGGGLYASRNHNQLRHTYDAPGANRAQVDWNLTLRQVRKKPTNNFASAASLPNLEAQNREGHRNEPLVAEHQDGQYHSKWLNQHTRSCPELETIGKYGNVGETGHMVHGATRVSSGAAHTIDWQLNLRGGQYALLSVDDKARKQKDEEKSKEKEDRWRRHYARPQQSFDMMRENCSLNNEAYQKSHITPQDRRPDRNTGAICIGTIRDDPMDFDHMPGNEGTDVSQWRHLIECRRGGHKSRRQMQAEATLRENPSDDRAVGGAKITHNRSHGCIVEMLGKKKWVGHEHHDAMSSRPPDGDPRLHHLSRHRIGSEADEENREKRKTKTPKRECKPKEPLSTRGARSAPAASGGGSP